MLIFSFGNKLRIRGFSYLMSIAATPIVIFSSQQKAIAAQIVLDLNKSHVEIAPSISVINSKGAKLPGITSIQNYNQSTRKLSFEDVSGSFKEVGISEFKKVIFTRELRQQQIQVQVAIYSTIELKRGERLTLLIPRASFNLKNGLVSLNQNWVRPNSTPLFAVEGTTRLEPISLEYNIREDKFVLSAQYINFLRKHHGSSGGNQNGGKVIQ
jgi:hypothetical protein